MESETTHPSEEWDLLGRTADGLTLMRLVIAAALVPILEARHLTLAAALVGLAWLSDFLDGRAARASSATSRLGPYDLWVDSLVGAGLLVGFVAWGWVPWIAGVGAVGVLLTAFALTRSEAFSMLLQAIAYALLLLRTWWDGPPGSFAWLLAIIVLVAVVNRRVFLERSVPTFLGGMADVFRRRTSR